MNASLQSFLDQWDKSYSEEHQMVGQSLKSPGYHTTVADGAWVHETRSGVDYAIALLQSGEPTCVERAQRVVAKILTFQDRIPTSATYGIWPWLLEEPLAKMSPPDWNWADFIGARLAQILLEHGGQLDANLVSEIRAALGHAAWSIFRRNVQSNYTNIAIMGGCVTSAAGEILGEPRLLDYGRRRLANMVDHVRWHGNFNEYNSPAYTVVAVHECERILQLLKDPAVRQSAEVLRQSAWAVIASHFHPSTQQWAPPHSRAYTDLLSAQTVSYLSRCIDIPIIEHLTRQPAPALWSPIKNLPCPPEYVDRFKKLPQTQMMLKERFIRKDLESESCYATTWLSEDACLGSFNICCGWTQHRFFQAYLRIAEEALAVLRLRFLHDGRDFSTGHCRTMQESNRTLTVFNFIRDRGDFHIVLDKPNRGIFHIDDLRLRYELRGKGVKVSPLENHRFLLRVGPWRILLHASVKGQFGPQPVRWEIGQQDEHAYVDCILHSGPTLAFDPQTYGPLVQAAGMEILRDDAPPATELPSVCLQDDQLTASWINSMRVTAPTVETYA